MTKSTHFKRFAILFAMVGIFGAAMLFMPLKKGMDLEGGHSLIFRIDMTGSQSPARDQTLMIDILKERVDPLGLATLEWRPVGDDRIEVRMPVGTRESRVARAEYDGVLEDLRNSSIRPADLERILTTAPDQREQAIASRTGNAKQRELLAAAAKAYDEMQPKLKEIDDKLVELQRRGEQLKSATAATQPSDEQTKQLDELNAEIQTLQGDRLEAREGYAAAEKAVFDSNVDVQALTYALTSFYVPKQVAGEMVKSEVTRRNEELNRRLTDLRGRYDASTVKLIDNVVDAYQAWAEIRRPLDDPDDLIRLIRRTGQLEFRMAPAAGGKNFGPQQIDNLDKYYRQIQEEGPEAGRERGERFGWFKISNPDDFRDGRFVVWPQDPAFKGDRYVLLSNEDAHALLHKTGTDDWKLADARRTSKDARPIVEFTFDDRGADKFAGLTGSHVGDLMAILLDDEVYSAPVINSQIHKTGIIEGRFTVQEVDDLVKTLKAGSLPAKLVIPPVSRESIGATLGQANIQRGLRAGYIGLICVVAFMAAIYLFGGMVANFALALNVVLVLGAMALLQATFTMPGIAGVILTIGMAVDANVLIFERLREEQARTQSMKMAIKNAYSRAFSAIFDGNLTTLITCVVLGWVGTQEVRGFAVTLGMGLLFSMFTALLVTRWIFDLLLDTNLLKNRLHMVKLVGVPNFDWMGKRYIFYIISGVTFVAGVASIIAQGRNLLGIEFSSGSRAIVRVADDKMFQADNKDAWLADADVQKQIDEQAKKLGLDGMSGANLMVTEVKTDTKAADFLEAYDANRDGFVETSEWERTDKSPETFAKYLARLDGDKDGKLSRTELAGLPEMRFQITSAESHAETVRQVIDAALKDRLNIRNKLPYEFVADQPIPALNLLAGPPKAEQIEIARSDVDTITQPTLKATLRNNEGGILLAFTLKEGQSLRLDELQDRLRTARDLAERGTTQTAMADVLPLVTAPGSSTRYTAFALAVRPEGLKAGAKQDWEDFSQQQRSIVADALESEESLESLTNFDAAQTKATSARAILAVVLSWAGIIIYLALRFGSPRWGIAAVVCLIHDSFIVLGLVAATAWLTPLLGGALLISPFKIDMTMIAALLTVIGYSVNDTIVIFDRIRENRGRLTKITPTLINLSVNQTLSRTLLTGGTTIIVILVMYIWGGDSIRGFNFALLTGILFGTYSSIAVAAPLLMGFKAALTSRIVSAAPAEQPAEMNEVVK